MSDTEEKYIGYLKYSGEAVQDGLMGARESAEALLGFDEMLRHFVAKEEPLLKNADFEIPVRIKKGSWEALIPAGLALWFGKDYLSAVAKKAGSDGLFETGPAKDIVKIFEFSLQVIQWMIKIASHTGEFGKEVKNIKFRNNNKEVGIPNDQNEYLYVPFEYWKFFQECPQNIFSKNAKLISQKRILKIGVIKNDKKQEVTITEKQKFIFYSEKDEESEDILFPELKHGQVVELEGVITRINEKTSTVGLEYKNHILTCKPQNGNIAAFKEKIISQVDEHFFPKIKMIGVIDRTDENNLFKNPRPQVIFSDIVPLERSDNTPKLFN